jgi:hypothetical protein
VAGSAAELLAAQLLGALQAAAGVAAACLLPCCLLLLGYRRGERRTDVNALRAP